MKICKSSLPGLLLELPALLTDYDIPRGGTVIFGTSMYRDRWGCLVVCLHPLDIRYLPPKKPAMKLIYATVTYLVEKTALLDKEGFSDGNLHIFTAYIDKNIRISFYYAAECPIMRAVSTDTATELILRYEGWVYGEPLWLRDSVAAFFH